MPRSPAIGALQHAAPPSSKLTVDDPISSLTFEITSELPPARSGDRARRLHAVAHFEHRRPSSSSRSRCPITSDITRKTCAS
jgi:hypothetical protein